METPKKLNPRQRKYVKEYCKTGNGTRSVMKAYNQPNANHAGNQAVRLNKKPLVKQAIEEHLAEAGYSPVDSVKRLQQATRYGLANKQTAKVSDSIRADELLLKLSGVLVDRKQTAKLNINIDNADLHTLYKLRKKYQRLLDK